MLHNFEEYYNVSGFLWITCFCVVFFYLFAYFEKEKRLPPGPIGLPLVGYVPFLTKLPFLKMMNLASYYGNVFSLRLGSNFYVVLNKSRIIRETLNKPEFLGRPPNSIFSVLKSFESAFFSNGRTWQEQRRFSLHAMRDLGFGKSHMEGLIQEEIQHFLEIITKSNGAPLEVTKNLTSSVSNSICSLVFGRRYNYEDARRKFLDETVDYVSASTQQLKPYVFFPWLRNLPFSGMVFRTGILSKHLKDLSAFIRERIDEHERTLDPDNIRDFIDGYLIEMKTQLQKDHQTVFSRNMLTGNVINFFAAGTETVRTTLTWCMYTMAVFQDVQKKVQNEIDDVIGNERMPSWKDQKEMPFTQAVLMEVHRWKTIAPIGIVRYTTQDTEIDGYFIPKGTCVIAHLWAAHHDPEEWEHPDEFIPDRFLSKDGKSVVKGENYMPFSTGKRSCPAETLAVVEVFLYFASVLQRFTVKLPAGTSPDFDGEFGVTYRPNTRTLCFQRRS